ncbi:MAG: hypothetical protein KHY31_04245 [Clostridiales bacterium]|nr:hypothetical protein [Clostridiales bacterium]
MGLNINEIRDFLYKRKIDFVYSGDRELLIETFSSLNHLKNSSITWIKKVEQKKLENLCKTENLLVVCRKEPLCAGYPKLNFLFCENPKQVFFSILTAFFSTQEIWGISDTAVVETKVVGKGCSIGHHSYLGPQVIVEDNVSIGHNVVLQNKVHIKENSIIGSGCIIGGEGFGYFKDLDGISQKVPHYGGVIIGKNVEIGANTCIDRGTIDDTVIGDYVRIDNLCHIAHNVVIGDKCKVIALSLLGGSSHLEESVYIAPGVMVKNQVNIGENCVVGMGAVVLKDAERNQVVLGMPAKPVRRVTEEDKML